LEKNEINIPNVYINKQHLLTMQYQTSAYPFFLILHQNFL